MKRIAFALVALAACSSTPPELSLDIRLPDDRSLFAGVASLTLKATRDSAPLAQSTFAASTQSVSLEGVSHGARTIVELDGADSTGSVIARGRTCTFDFEGAGTTAPLYFAPTNFFASTASAPAATRTYPVAMALSDGTVLLAGGADTAGTALASSELFTPGAATFAASGATMIHARRSAEGTPLPSTGLFVTGGVDATGAVVADAELYQESLKSFTAIKAAAIGARVDHRALLLADGSVFVSGGTATEGGAPLATTAIVYIATDGTFQATAGPTLVTARRAHATTLAIGVPVVIGGYGADGKPLDSIEIVDVSSGTATTVGHLQTARADATASVLDDGSILVVGGVGGSGVLADAELYNPVLAAEPSYKTTVYSLAVARHGHTATVLSDGRVLIAGGFGADGKAVDSVELFVTGVRFVSERSLGTPRAGHVTVPLCDGTALVVGGGTGAELYNGPAD
ncbi:MAG TPA: kelch repeat-containing protein [Polyangia bacterium]|nr:kelch repeat-containing protein [Polyangia bacterium]